MSVPRILVVSSLKSAFPNWTSVFPGTHWDLILERELTNITQRLSEITPDILILEIETTESFILILIKKIRGEAVIPILLLTSINTEDFLLEAYDVGVDDCILRPISLPILRAKVKAWLRHSWSMPVGLLDPLLVGTIKLIPVERTVIIDGSDPIHLSNLEFRMLYFLLSRRNHIMTTEELCQRIWLDHDGGDTTALKNVVYRLRKKIEADPHNPQFLRTIVGIGYEFVTP